MERIATQVVRQKASRIDSTKPLQLIQRRRVINREIVSWMANRSMRGTLTVDACAGIEGSLMAVMERGGKWIGNDVCMGDISLLQDTVRSMKNANISAIHQDAHHLPLKADSADFFLLVFAIAHLRTFDALSEAKRITAPGGKIVICCPGPTFWIMDIIIYDTLLGIKSSSTDAAAKLLAARPAFKRNVDMFESDVLRAAEMTVNDYVGFTLAMNFGIRNKERFVGEVEKGLGSAKKDAKRGWNTLRGILDAFYWNNLFVSLKKHGLPVLRAGVMPIVEYSPRTEGDPGWAVGAVRDCEIGQEAFYRSELDQMFPKEFIRGMTGGEAPHKLIFGRTLIAKKT